MKVIFLWITITQTPTFTLCENIHLFVWTSSLWILSKVFQAVSCLKVETSDSVDIFKELLVGPTGGIPALVDFFPQRVPLSAFLWHYFPSSFIFGSHSLTDASCFIQAPESHTWELLTQCVVSGFSSCISWHVWLLLSWLRSLHVIVAQLFYIYNHPSWPKCYWLYFFCLSIDILCIHII